MNKMQFYPGHASRWQDELTATDRDHLSKGGSIRHTRDSKGMMHTTYHSAAETRRTSPAWSSNATERAKANARAARAQRELAECIERNRYE
jgi:hypothetical protein